MSNFKRTFTWILGFGFIAYLIFIFVWFTLLSITPDILKIIIDQWLAMIVFPSACFAALVVVMVLDQAAGDIEFKGLGFEFKGASGPIVLWGMLVLIMAISLYLLWQTS